MEVAELKCLAERLMRGAPKTVVSQTHTTVPVAQATNLPSGEKQHRYSFPHQLCTSILITSPGPESGTVATLAPY